MLIVAISVGVALLPTVAPTIYDQFPQWFTLIFDSGISAGAIAAILLNLLLNSEEMRREHARRSRRSGRTTRCGDRPRRRSCIRMPRGRASFPRRVLGDELTAEQVGDGVPVDVSRIDPDNPGGGTS